MTFFSLEALNKEIRLLLSDYNRLLLQRKEASRRELFQTVERTYLKPLPSEKYEIKAYRRAKVQKIGYVYFSPDKTYYSVPYRYIGRRTLIHYTKSYVEVYYNHERIAAHQRSPVKGSYNTAREHLSSTHQAYLDWSPAWFKDKALVHGYFVGRCVEQIFSSMDYPEVGYKRVMGLLQLHKIYGSDRLNKACEIAFNTEMVSYTRIKNILKNSMDKTSIFYREFEEDQSHIPEHGNIRGAAAYR